MEVMTEEERQSFLELSRKLNEAAACGDDERYFELIKEIEAPAEALMAIKMHSGAEWIREKGLNTKRADEKYGAGWLDR